jgi:protein-disulfide isomerase
MSNVLIAILFEIGFAMLLTVPVNESDHIQGSVDAPITLLEYGDYQSPRCQESHGVIKALQREWCSDAEARRWRFIYRHFPLAAIHAYAQFAAEIAEAAAAQGQFWQMHSYLFEHPQAIANGALLHYAARLRLDVDRLEREVAEHVYAERVHEHWRGGVNSGVNGTPTFFINGVRHDGDCSLNVLSTVIAD